MVDIEIINAKPIDLDVQQAAETDVEPTKANGPDVQTWQGILGRPFTDLSAFFYVWDGELRLSTEEVVEPNNIMPVTSNAVYEAILPLAQRVANIKDGKDGEDGYTPIKGVDYNDGNDGYTPIKGVDYNDGYTPIKGVDYNDGRDFKYEDFTQAQLEALKGPKGDNGKTPVKGTDYYTAAEKAELVREISSAVGGLEYVFLSESQVDASGKPNFVGAANKFYFVPDADGVSPNLFVEWLYTERGWEQIGASKINLDGYATETWVEAKGYLTEYTESDPTVPAWAKAVSKPKYTAAEVGALPNTTVIPTVPANVSAFNNDAGYLTQHQSLAGYAKTEDIPSDSHINSLIQAALGVIENGTY